MPGPLNCVILEDDATSRGILEKFIEKTDGLELTGSYDHPEQALNHLQQEPPDVLFLDVELPQMNGMQVIESLDQAPLVVFVTSERDYALEAFEHKAVDFLLKPLEYSRFIKAVSRVREITDLSAENKPEFGLDAIFVRHNAKYIKVPMSEIMWVEAIGDYMQIHTANRRFTVHSTMKAMESKLPLRDFRRVHRSYIVRLDSIQEIEDNTLVLTGKKLVPVGKSYRTALLDSLNML